MPYRVAVTICVVALAMLIGDSSARAGGYEFPGYGTRSLGRGGAFAARADEPMAVIVNPAALASNPGIQLAGSLDLLFAKDCFNRNQFGVAADGTTPTVPAWDQGWGTDAAGNRIGYTTVCNQKAKQLTAISSLGFSWHVRKRFGFGVMVNAPNSERAQRWGSRSYQPPGQTNGYSGYVDAPANSRGTAGDDPLVPLDNGERLLPASSRFLLVDRRIDLYYVTLGIGWKPVRQVQLGAAAGCGIAVVDFTYNVRYGNSGEEPNSGEGQVQIHARDGCAPRIVASIHVIPHDILDIVGVFRYDFPIKASGTIQSQQGQAVGNPLEGNATITIPRPLWLTGGIRFANRIDRRPLNPDARGRESGRVEDQMANERWDVELNVVYEHNSIVSDFLLDGDSFGQIKFGHNWQNQLSLRLGSDINVLPGALALRGGFSYETSGFTAIGKQRRISNGGTIDFMPGQRFGLHAGLTTRFNLRCSLAFREKCLNQPHKFQKRAEISVAFAYFWMTTHNNGNAGTEANPTGGAQQIVLDGPLQVSGDAANNGAFSSRYIVASLAFRYIFGGRQKGVRRTASVEPGREPF